MTNKKRRYTYFYVSKYVTLVPSYPNLKDHLLGMAGPGAAIVSVGSFWALSFPGSAARWDGMDSGSTIATVFLSLLPVQQGKLSLSWTDTTHLDILLHIAVQSKLTFAAQWRQSAKYESNKHTGLLDALEPPFSNIWVFFIFLQWRNLILLLWKGLPKIKFYCLTPTQSKLELQYKSRSKTSASKTDPDNLLDDISSSPTPPNSKRHGAAESFFITKFTTLLVVS